MWEDNCPRKIGFQDFVRKYSTLFPERVEQYAKHACMEDEKVREEVAIFNDCKRKMDSREPFSEFETKLARIIAKLRWNQ